MKIPGRRPGISSLAWTCFFIFKNKIIQIDIILSGFFHIIPSPDFSTGQYMYATKNNLPDFVDSLQFFRYNSRADMHQ